MRVFQAAQADVARNLASEVLQCHFHCILLVKQVIKASADSRGRKLDPSFQINNDLGDREG